MIRKIGVIYQDVYSLGFLDGLKSRLGCAAQLVRPPASVGPTQFMTRKQVRIACERFRREGVDLVVRFTDADEKAWREVLKEEKKVFVGTEFEARFVCGVAASNPEDWLSLDSKYLASELEMDVGLLRDGRRSAAVKRAIGLAARLANVGSADIVRRLVAEAPGGVFQQWLQDDAFKQFYRDCRSIAIRLGCEPEPANEL